MKLIIDCDPGIDDALALAVTLLNKDIELLGITTVSGNREVEKTTVNALKTLDYFGRVDIPVYKGAAKPLKKELFKPEAISIHGVDGLGDADLPKPKISVRGNAGQFLKKAVEENPGEITILAIGPLTNIAMLLEQVDNKKIKEIYIMGGTFQVAGNVTKFAEFNAYIDPDAAAAVFKSPIPIKVVGLDVTNQIFLTRREFENYETIDTPQAKFFTKIYNGPIKREKKDKYAIFWDVVTAAWLFENDLIQGKKGSVEVVTGGEQVGRIIFNEGSGNTVAGEKINPEKFWQYFDEFLKS